MKALGYCRVSTSRQVEDGISLDNQEAKIKAYCDLNSLTLVQVIKDEGLSGKSLNREGLAEVLRMIDKREVQHVIVYSLSRLSRKTLDILNLIELFEKKGVSFHSITEKLDTSSPTGKFFLTILSALSQLERDQISERTSQALAYKKSQGQKCGGFIPFGFSVSEGKLIQCSEEMLLVNRMKQLKSEGLSLKKISSKLYAEGHTNRKGEAFHPQCVKQVLSYHSSYYERNMISPNF